MRHTNTLPFRCALSTRRIRLACDPHLDTAASRGTATRALVICGFDHVGALAETLSEDCKTIRLVDYRQQRWYQAGVFAELRSRSLTQPPKGVVMVFAEARPSYQNPQIAVGRLSSLTASLRPSTWRISRCPTIRSPRDSIRVFQYCS